MQAEIGHDNPKPTTQKKTVADELAFFTLHEAYHVGQLSYVRKGLGYPGASPAEPTGAVDETRRSDDQGV